MKSNSKSKSFSHLPSLGLIAGKWPVVWFIPNLVGYLRILLLIGCYFYKDHQFEKFAVLYFVSFVLDYFDGLFARMFKQTSKFGGLLDMLTDRMGTLVLYFINFELMAKAPFQCAIRNNFDSLHGNPYTFFTKIRGYMHHT